MRLIFRKNQLPSTLIALFLVFVQCQFESPREVLVCVEEISELTFELQLKLNFLNSDFNDWGVVSAPAKFNLDGVRRIGVVFDYFVAPKYPNWLSVQLGPGHRC